MGLSLCICSERLPLAHLLSLIVLRLSIRGLFACARAEIGPVLKRGPGALFPAHECPSNSSPTCRFESYYTFRISLFPSLCFSLSLACAHAYTHSHTAVSCFTRRPAVSCDPFRQRGRRPGNAASVCQSLGVLSSDSEPPPGSSPSRLPCN